MGKEMNKLYYRPLWTCGRYNKFINKAIVYNLLEGMTHLFEDDSAEVINCILQCQKGAIIPFEAIAEKLDIHEESLTGFLNN